MTENSFVYSTVYTKNSIKKDGPASVPETLG